jgi:thiol:disulfide interchange protein DsbC
VNVILFPLSFHKKAPAMVEWIMQGKNNAEKKARFEEVMLNNSTEYKALIKDDKKPFVYSKELQGYIGKSQATARELKMRGTPALYDAEFNPISQDEILKSQKK